jgi:hypothetical protein
MENELAILNAAGFRITRKTTLDAICEKMTELGHEFYYEWARELKAFAVPAKIKTAPAKAYDPNRGAPWA